VTFLVLGALTVVTVVGSFAFSLAVLVLSRQPQATPVRTGTAAPDAAAESATASVAGEASDTMSRVLRDVERLATLRERGALTDKEFAAQKAKLLVPPASPRTRRPQRTT
jgi:Short C-terminal domain